MIPEIVDNKTKQINAKKDHTGKQQIFRQDQSTCKSCRRKDHPVSQRFSRQIQTFFLLKPSLIHIRQGIHCTEQTDNKHDQRLFPCITADYDIRGAAYNHCRHRYDAKDQIVLKQKRPLHVRRLIDTDLKRSYGCHQLTDRPGNAENICLAVV